MTKLTAKQQAFVDHYLTCFNAAEAARLAGYSEKTARSIGYENLTKPDIQKEVSARVSELTMTADEALLLMTRIARGDLSQYIYDDGDIGIKELKESGDGRLLKKYKRTRNTTRRKNGDEFESESIDFEFYAADAALRGILKIHGKYGPLGTDDDPIQHAISVVNMDIDRLKSNK